ncbi:hypothetical protein HCH52_02365 [Oscillospiraceae bacterium HV4-5-C5C]|nr:hypothetical protein [Oscillospiraceae bacterium HV4-5-C5C]
MTNQTRTKPKTVARRRRKFRPGRLNFLLLLAFIAALTLLVVLIVRKNSPQTAGSTADAAAGQLLFNLSDHQADKLWAIGTDKLLEKKGTTLSLLSLDGQQREVLFQDYDDPQIVSASGRVLIYELSGYRYNVIDANQNLYGGTTAAPIAGGALSDQGACALILDTEDSKGQVSVYNTSGDKLFDWQAQDSTFSGYPIKLLFSPDGQTLDVALYNTESNEPKSFINRFDLNQEQLGQRLAQFQPDSTGPVGGLAYFDAGTMVAADDHQLFKLADGQIENWLSLGTIYSLTSVNEQVLLIASATVGDQASAYMLNTTTDSLPETSLALGDQPSVPKISGNLAAVSSGQQLWLISQGKLDSARSYDLKSEITSFDLDSKGRILCVTEDAVRLIKP